ncbi:Histone acetyltransferase KAT6A [Gossypium australe]|uniref:Histone acetyltransferase KAT6A n=1 Tax=Gossypium australe TaxID=47621 RepID=A0A5B6WAP7_9ROSI|nr:Histone acetyltransferase KAT6A [Gossypium australe]
MQVCVSHRCQVETQTEAMPSQDVERILELETEEVLKQLKYLEMLRPRLSADRRKSDRTNNCTSQDRKCDTRNAKS